MFDELNSDDLGEGRKRSPEHKRPLSDREVPLGSTTTAIAEAVHSWLDGELPESQVRRGESSRDVEFWKRLDDDLAARRRMRTPAYLQARIMDALPQHTPTMITPFWRREFVVTPSSALLAAAALMVVAAAATALVMRLPH
jgi:hypothetical protein